MIMMAMKQASGAGVSNTSLANHKQLVAPYSLPKYYWTLCWSAQAWQTCSFYPVFSCLWHVWLHVVMKCADIGHMSSQPRQSHRGFLGGSERAACYVIKIATFSQCLSVSNPSSLSNCFSPKCFSQEPDQGCRICIITNRNTHFRSTDWYHQNRPVIFSLLSYLIEKGQYLK